MAAVTLQACTSDFSHFPPTARQGSTRIHPGETKRPRLAGEVHPPEALLHPPPAQALLWARSRSHLPTAGSEKALPLSLPASSRADHCVLRPVGENAPLKAVVTLCPDPREGQGLGGSAEVPLVTCSVTQVHENLVHPHSEEDALLPACFPH